MKYNHTVVLLLLLYIVIVGAFYSAAVDGSAAAASHIVNFLNTWLLYKLCCAHFKLMSMINCACPSVQYHVDRHLAFLNFHITPSYERNFL